MAFPVRHRSASRGHRGRRAGTTPTLSVLPGELPYLTLPVQRLPGEKGGRDILSDDSALHACPLCGYCICNKKEVNSLHDRELNESVCGGHLPLIPFSKVIMIFL